MGSENTELEEKKLGDVLYDVKTPEHEFQEVLKRHMEDGKEISLGELFYSPHVSVDQFRAIMRHYQESGNLEFALPHLRRIYLSRRRFLGMAAALGSVFALSSFAACTQPQSTEKTSTAVIESPSPKAIKKEKLGLGAISVLDCEAYGYIIKERKILEEMGYDMKYVFVPTSPALIEAFIAGEIDSLYPGVGNPAIAIEKGVVMKNAATSMIGHGGWNVSTELYKRGITDMEKFFEYCKQRKAEGNPVKISGQVPGTTANLMMQLTIMKYGLDPKKDVELKLMPPAEVTAAFIGGQVEAQSHCEQYDSYPEYFQKGVVIGHGLSEKPYVAYLHPDADKENTYAICTSFAYNPKLSPQAKKDYIEAQKKAAQFMREQPQEAMLMMSKISKTPLAVEYVGMFRRARWQVGLWYDSVMQHYKANQMLGLVKGTLKLEDQIDTEFAIEIKPPFPSLAGEVTQDGPVNVCTDQFRKDAWTKAMGDVPLFK